ncbi:hypothetical protein TSAR_008932 [Trichomalopsis sarcophagae]|uniref:Major facilitator superfamily (MFS) profile domain-containing protein n=1 Tax=Trichomalopsis sarcophagae TaxID=543379 RepID=A0A232FHP1_9HYME|nr:hypothetical protein TSAR_008932 [Trichomalopsis sarcophagae]
MSSSQNRRQMMQPWPLCLINFGKTKERAILPKYYTRVPSIARSSTGSSSLVQDCASNATLLTNVSPFNSQVALIADKRSASSSRQQGSSPAQVEIQEQLASSSTTEAKSSQQHYYAENLRNNHHRTLNGSQIYDPLRKDREVDYKQLDPLLRKDEPASDTKILMDSQDLKKPEAACRVVVSQFEKEKRRTHFYWSQILMRADTHVNIEVPGNQPVAKCTFSQSSWVGSIMPLSALFGGIAGGPLIEYIGRRNTILFTAFPFIISWLLIGLASNVAMILSGRALSGFCVGVASLSLPVYLGETIQPEVRGSLGLLPTAFGNIGILVSYVVGMYLNWWKLALFGAILPLPFALLMVMIPETPRWYISKGKTKRARRSLQWLRGRSADVSDELTAIEKTHVESERQATQGALTELFKGNNFKPLLISLGLMFFQQMSGINAVIFYTVMIFDAAETSMDANLCTIIVGIVNFASTFLATALIDRLGRKILLYMSSVSMIVSLVVLGAFFYIKNVDPLRAASLGWLPLTAFVVYVLGFSLASVKSEPLLARELQSAIPRAYATAAFKPMRRDDAASKFLLAQASEPNTPVDHSLSPQKNSVQLIVKQRVDTEFLFTTGIKNESTENQTEADINANQMRFQIESGISDTLTTLL